MRGFAFAFGLSILVSPAFAATHKTPPAPCKTREEAIGQLKSIADNGGGSLMDVDAAGTKLMLPVWDSNPPATHTVAEEILILIAPDQPKGLLIFIHDGKACGKIGMASGPVLFAMIEALPDKPKTPESTPKPESHALPDSDQEPDLKL